MVLISKKRIELVFSLVIASTLIFTISNRSEEVENTNTVQTVSLPVTNKVIVVDAGHGIPDERSRK
jgi:N-acetylmuramoyl-L-alanine amidase